MTSESRGSLLAMLEHQSVSAVVDAPQVPGASSSTRLSLPVSLPGSCGRSGRAPLTRTHVLLPWGPGSGGALGPVLLTVAAPAGEQKRQCLLLSRYRGGHTAPSLVLPWSEQRARPGLQETWQECEPARWENAAAAGRWRAAASTWRSHVFTPLPREGACMFTRPAQPLLTSHLVNQRAGLLPPCWWSRGRVIGTKAAIWKVGARSGGQPQGPPGSCSEPRIGRGLAVCPSHGSGQPSGSCTPLILPGSLLEGAGRDVLPCGKQIS